MAEVREKLLGANGNKGMIQRSGVVATGGASAIVALQPIAEMISSDPRLQTSIVTLGTLFISVLLTTFGNPSKK